MYFRHYLLIKKGVILHFSFTHGLFMPSLVGIDLVVLKKKIKIWKVYKQTNGRTTGDGDLKSKCNQPAHVSTKKEMIVETYFSHTVRVDLNCYKNHVSINRNSQISGVVKAYKAIKLGIMMLHIGIANPYGYNWSTTTRLTGLLVHCSSSRSRFFLLRGIC